MIVVSNSSPLIGLSAIGKLELLENLYQTIYVPEIVFREVAEEGENRPGAKEIRNAVWIKTYEVDKRQIEEVSLNAGLGQGESASLILAKRLNADLLIIDDLKARKFAVGQKQEIIGILGILLLSKAENLITKINKPLDDLILFGYWISPKLYRKILEVAGE
jgi:predicted nucleic acid-binding protein